LIVWARIAFDMTRLFRPHAAEPDRHRRSSWLTPVTIRLAARPDGEAIAKVAERDSQPTPPGPHLVAERDGSIVAVLSLRNGKVVADPFRRTRELVELLREACA
jgi:hypothetical protein